MNTEMNTEINTKATGRKTPEKPTTTELTTETLFKLLLLRPEFLQSFSVSGKIVSAYKVINTSDREYYAVIVTTPDTNLVINLLLYIVSEEELNSVLTALKDCKDTDCIDDILDRFI